MLPFRATGAGRGGRLAGKCHLPQRSDDQIQRSGRPLPGLAEEKPSGLSLREERPSAEGTTGRPCWGSPPSLSRGSRGAVVSWKVVPSSVLRVGAFVLPLRITFTLRFSSAVTFIFSCLVELL